MRCQDCRTTLCDNCSCEHSDKKHDLKSLVEEKCDDHGQNLELYCFRCEANICVACFLESHQGHQCDAIAKVAEDLSELLKSGVELLRSCGSRLETVLNSVLKEKKKYERQLSDLEDLVSGRATAAEEAFQLENGQKNVESFTKANLKAINAIIQRSDSGKTIDKKQVIGLIQDVKVLVGVVLLKLSNHVRTLQKALGDVEKLNTSAKLNEMVCRQSTSTCDVTVSAVAIYHLDEEMDSLRQQPNVKTYLDLVGKEQLHITILM